MRKFFLCLASIVFCAFSLVAMDEGDATMLVGKVDSSADVVIPKAFDPEGGDFLSIGSAGTQVFATGVDGLLYRYDPSSPDVRWKLFELIDRDTNKSFNEVVHVAGFGSGLIVLTQGVKTYQYHWTPDEARKFLPTTKKEKTEKIEKKKVEKAKVKKSKKAKAKKVATKKAKGKKTGVKSAKKTSKKDGVVTKKRVVKKRELVGKTGKKSKRYDSDRYARYRRNVSSKDEK